MLDNFTFEDWKTLFERFRTESEDDKEAIEKLGEYIPVFLSGCDWLCNKQISHKRCEEINCMKISCPWGGYEDIYKPYFLMNEMETYIASKDESIVFAFAFGPCHGDRELGIHEDTYLLVKGDEYFLFHYDYADTMIDIMSL